MTDINDTYLKLGRAIAGRCPAGFDTAELAAEIKGDDTDLFITCHPEPERRIDIDPTPVAGEIRKCLEIIRDEMAKDGGGLWRSCTVTLRKGGHFAMDVSDDPLPPRDGKGFQIIFR